MTRSFRRTAAFRGCLIIPGLLAACATAVDAQEIPPARFESATRPPPPLAIRDAELETPALRQVTRVPLPDIAFATALGGAGGGAVGAVAGAAAGTLLGGGSEYFSPPAVLGVLGFAVGYPIGAAIGARRGATVDGARPSLGQLLLVSALSAGLGGVVWNRVGEAFESEASLTSWYMGAVAGFATHLAITSLAARRAPAVPAGAVAPAGDPGG